ncbi:hypothetical protein [Hymenobacter psychrophilus]|uniref:Uncharacterized protein n=1 Tax=Hymenobacter psychrophilus TaxID=651662 RepID=A0A1H3JNK3_9BACT|nr:hypothetical protein [Hymenobacter psychrophilus]SDY41513.1 hypothetical protein SAMN04488069_108157 [Hymenobacter psychrophilus]
MKKDILFQPVTGVGVAVTPDERAATATAEAPGWQVFLLNDNDEPLQNVIVSSSGYGTDAQGEPVRTSTLRHALPEVPPHAAAPIEALDSALFHLHNQYWVSYYIAGQVFDRKFVFAPDSISFGQLQPISLLIPQGILAT